MCISRIFNFLLELEMNYYYYYWLVSWSLNFFLRMPIFCSWPRRTNIKQTHQFDRLGSCMKSKKSSFLVPGSVLRGCWASHEPPDIYFSSSVTQANHPFPTHSRAELQGSRCHLFIHLFIYLVMPSEAGCALTLDPGEEGRQGAAIREPAFSG